MQQSCFAAASLLIMAYWCTSMSMHWKEMATNLGMLAQILSNVVMTKSPGPLDSRAAIMGDSRCLCPICKQRDDVIQAALASSCHQCCGPCQQAKVLE